MPKISLAALSRPRPQAEAISLYRDALLRDAAPDELAHLGRALDPEVVSWLELFRAAQREPLPLDPAFVARLDRVVATAPGPHPSNPDPPSRGRLRLTRSHAVQIPLPVRPLAGPAFAPRQLLPPLATGVLLLVVLLAGLYIAGPLRPRLSEPMLGAMESPVQFAFLWETTGGPDFFSRPYGLGIAPDGNLWVANGGQDRFEIFAPDGSYLETWGSPGSAEGEFEFYAPESGYGIAYGDVDFDADGNIYVLDTGNHRVQKFGPDRHFLLAWGSTGDGEGQFLAPPSIAVSPEGRVYVPDENRHDVQIFDSEGAYLGAFGEYGSGDGQFNVTAGVTVDGSGDVWVADYSSGRIQRFSADGEFRDAWGSPGSGDGQISSPDGVAVDARGNVLVIEAGNRRVQALTADGRFLAKIGGPKDPVQFSGGNAIVVDAAGTIYVSDDLSVKAFRLVAEDEN
jgi:DNA-binding beta-propeller fold protein YncE